jgi:nanoRNase/pAp phosphatase (c-di-AMP/oligoRNAs hydrolase)
MAELGEVLSGARSKSLLILEHNNPDPDTIAAAYGLSFLLKKKFGVRSIIGYGGAVTRAENKAMVHRLRIPMTRLSRVDPSKYYGIALVDAQPGTGNNLLEARHGVPLIVIDHHPRRKISARSPLHDIRPRYGATSTIVTEYIAATGLRPTRSLANALLYGIKTDTNSLVRAVHESDFKAFKYLFPLSNPRVIGWIERPALTREYFSDYARGLSKAVLYRDVAVSYLGRIESEAIIPEFADLLLRLDGVCWSLCMGRIGSSLMLSLRSTSRTYAADRVMRKLCSGKGPAGGHKDMAGAQIPLDGLNRVEVRGLVDGIAGRFLSLIDREGIHPKPLVDI